jgi:acyl-CoA thioester hydrolase
MELIRSEFLSDFPIVIAVPIAWGEMDAFGHVNNIVFFRHFESARIALLDAIDFLEPASNDGVGPILASTHCRFRRPLTYPDTVHVGTRVRSIESDRFELEFRTVSLASSQTAAEGLGVVVAYHYANAHKTALPERVHTSIDTLSASVLGR